MYEKMTFDIKDAKLLRRVKSDEMCTLFYLGINTIK